MTYKYIEILKKEWKNPEAGEAYATKSPLTMMRILVKVYNKETNEPMVKPTKQTIFAMR